MELEQSVENSNRLDEVEKEIRKINFKKMKQLTQELTGTILFQEEKTYDQFSSISAEIIEDNELILGLEDVTLEDVDSGIDPAIKNASIILNKTELKKLISELQKLEKELNKQ